MNSFTSFSKSGVSRIPLEDFFRNSEQTAYQISPDGKCYYIEYKKVYTNDVMIICHSYSFVLQNVFHCLTGVFHSFELSKKLI